MSRDPKDNPQLTQSAHEDKNPETETEILSTESLEKVSQLLGTPCSNLSMVPSGRV